MDLMRSSVAELLIGFWFSIGAIITVETVNGLYHFVRALVSGK